MRGVTLRSFGDLLLNSHTRGAHRVEVALHGLGGTMRIQLKVHSPTGQERIIDLCDSEAQLRKITVMQLKDKLARELMIKEDIRIIFRTGWLEETSLLSSYGIRHMSTIQTVLKLHGGL